jgi:hypothetical protein
LFQFAHGFEHALPILFGPSGQMNNDVTANFLTGDTDNGYGAKRIFDLAFVGVLRYPIP